MRTDAARLAARRRRAQPRPRRRAGRPVRVRPRLPARRRAARRRRRSAGKFAGRAAGAGLRAAADRRRWPIGAARRRRLARRRRRAADFFALKGVARGARRGSSASTLEVEPGEQPFLHPGPRRARSWSAATAAGWIGELHPLVCRDLGPGRAAAASRSTSRRCWPPRRSGEETYEDVTTYPGRPPGHRGRRRRGRPGRARSARPCATAAASCCARPRSSTSTGRAGRRGAQEPGAAARVPGRRPDPDRRGGRRVRQAIARLEDRRVA